MWKYVLKRIGLALVTTVIIVSLSFFLIHLLPYQKPLGNYEARYSYYQKEIHLGYIYEMASPETSESAKLIDKVELKMLGTRYIYQTPTSTQYFLWIKNIVTKWDWGVSTYINPGNSASAIIMSKLPTTIKINVWSVIFSVPLGILLGIWAALKKNKPTDHIISTSIMVFISIPSFVLITLLMLLLCYRTGWLPTQWPAASSATTATVVKGYILPVICLSFGSICGYARFTRAELCEVMSSEYLLLARTKGLTKNQAIVRHALRNAMVPILPSILAEVIGLLGGSMILEQLYGIPGTGKLYVTAINSQDYNVLFVDMALYTVIGLVSGVFLDISYGFIDPRIRMGAK
jgi:oligopeptide transport system permease protein